jgi:hypothetical protein
MQKTVVVVSMFVAAIVAGLVFDHFVRPPPPAAREEAPTSVKEGFGLQKERGMPLDMQASEGVTGYAATSPLLGSEPKPVPLRPYEKANDQELFQFQDNRISADCCPSPFSSDRGCVCLTDAQIQQFESRGGNRA